MNSTPQATLAVGPFVDGSTDKATLLPDPDSKLLKMPRDSTGRTADATPHAASLIESLRDIGYSPETALADIIDNAITAKADHVEILSETAIDEPCVAILDDGQGMTELELVEAMRPGTRNPLEDRDMRDLGRFGLGLKSASFSQCRRLTVLTRRDGVTSGATWDLDNVARSNEWRIEMRDDISEVPWNDRLQAHGTLVVWERLDRMSGGITDDAIARTRHLNRVLSSAERHLCLVFHRFLEDGPHPLELGLNGRRLQPIDPFVSRHPACQEDPEEPLTLPSGTIAIRSYTLPHHKEMTDAEWEEAGGPEGHLKSQGFYVYRERRLIIQGGWLGLARQTELTKLCRVRIDIPNTMDASWKIDVKKASAQLPPVVRERLKHIVERFSETSRRTYQRRGRKLVDEARMPMWNRLLKDGAIIYRPDARHPALSEFAECLPNHLKPAFANCITLIGSSLPIEALQADMAGNAEDVRTDTADAAVIEQALKSMVPRLIERGLENEAIRKLLRDMDPFREAWDASKPLADKLLGGAVEDE